MIKDVSEQLFIFGSGSFHGAMVVFRRPRSDFMSSKSQTSLGLTLGAIVLAACVVIPAGAEQKTGSITASGCVQKGHFDDRFHLIGRNGKAYALRSSSVKLSDHIGHNVTIKGELKRDPKRDEWDFEGSEVSEEYGKGKIADFVDVEVTSLKMNSASCPAASHK